MDPHTSPSVYTTTGDGILTVPVLLRRIITALLLCTTTAGTATIPAQTCIARVEADLKTDIARVEASIIRWVVGNVLSPSTTRRVI